MPPVVILSCPEQLAPLTDASMGALADALISAAEQYHICRRAVMGAW